MILTKICLIKGDKETAIKYVNIAIDIGNRRIVDKVKKEPLFIPIMAKISVPFNFEEKEEKNNKLTKIEITAKEHLEEMVDITRHLSYNDINLLKKNKIVNTQNINRNNEKDEKQK